MLPKNNTIQSTQKGFRGYMTPEVVLAAGMNPHFEFKFAGVEPEPIKTWDDNNHRYVDPIVGYRYPVIQDTEGENSTVYRQNPVMVRVDGALVSFKFGDTVMFEDLLGYRNKAYKYSFQAASIKKVK